MPNKALADAQRALYGLRLPGLYTSPVTSHWIWAAQGRAYSLVRQPSVAEANPEVTDSHRLSTDLRASIWHNTSFFGKGSGKLVSCPPQRLTFGLPSLCLMSHALLIIWNTPICSQYISIFAKQGQLSCSFLYHVPPRKSWLISSSQIVPQNTRSPFGHEMPIFSSLSSVIHALNISWLSGMCQARI